MDDSKPTTAADLAAATDTDERYVAEWLATQVASGYVDYDADTQTFRLPEEQAFALTDEFNPVFVPGGLQVAASTIKDVDLIADAFRSGDGVEWGQHHQDLFDGTERFFRPNYIDKLTDEWIPALDGVVDKLTAGGRVADVGCGSGASTIIMAQAYPSSTFHGFDAHEPSLEAAVQAAEDGGVSGRVTFEVARAMDYPGLDYDLVTCFDCLHDMGDPVGAARHIRSSLASDGSWMLVEPQAGDTLESNLNPVGRIFYAASTLVCVPVSRSQDVDLALGAQAGQQRLTEVLTNGGFSHVSRAAETPFKHRPGGTPMKTNVGMVNLDTIIEPVEEGLAHVSPCPCRTSSTS